MPILLVQKRSQGTGTSPSAQSLAYSSSVTPGNFLACIVTTHNTGGDVTVAVEDDVNGAWTHANSLYESRANERISLHFLPNCGSGTTTVTVTPGANAYISFAIFEYSGVKKTNPLRDTSSNQGSATNTPSTSTITAGSGDLVLIGFGFSSVLLTSVVADSPFLDREQILDGGPTEGLCASDHVAATGNINGSWVADQAMSWQAIGASFRGAPGPAPQPLYTAKAYMIDAEYIETSTPRFPMLSVKLMGGSPDAIQPPIAQLVIVDREAVERAYQWHQTVQPAFEVKLMGGSPTVLQPPIGSIVITDREAIERAAQWHQLILPVVTTPPEPPTPTAIPVTVPHDPRAQPRTRQHQQIVAAILNSLIFREELIRIPGETARGIWTLGYNPSVVSDWPVPAPTTLAEALDVLAGIVGGGDRHLRVGDGPPAPGLGIAGDTYFDRSSGDLYWKE